MKSIVKMNSRIKNRIKCRSGFSIAEMLLAVLILMLATQLIAQCVALAARKFYESTDKSEAQMICSTLSDFVRNELSMADDIKLNGSELVSFIDESGRLGGRCKLDITEGKLAMQKVDDSTKVYYPIGGGNGSSYANGRLMISEFVTDCDTSKGNCITVKIKITTEAGKELASSEFFVIPFTGRVK